MGAAAAVLVACLVVGPLVLGGAWRVHLSPAPADLALSVVRFTAADGVPLTAWLADADSPKAVVVVVSGLGGNRSVEPVPAMTRDLLGRGYSVLALDLRGQGSAGDDPDRTPFGVGRAADIVAAVDWLAGHGRGGRIAVLGLGNGAQVALEAGAADRRISALVLQDADADPRHTLGRELGMVTGLPSWFVRPMLWSAERLWGHDLGHYHPLDAMAGFAPRPALLIGEAAGQRGLETLAAADPGARWWLADTGRGYGYYREAWIDRVASFLDGLFGTMFG